MAPACSKIGFENLLVDDPKHSKAQLDRSNNIIPLHGFSSYHKATWPFEEHLTDAEF